MRSLLTLLRLQPVPRRRALYQGLLFASFSLFWTASPIELARHHGLSQTQIAIFALVGAIGALATPVAGRLADAGHTRRASLVAMAIAAGAMLIGWTGPGAGVAGLALTGILLDFAVQMNIVLGQRALYALEPASRARLNALCMTSIFVGGAIGSALASSLYEAAGWSAIVLAGAVLPTSPCSPLSAESCVWLNNKRSQSKLKPFVSLQAVVHEIRRRCVVSGLAAA